jgi:hypothetical protein
LKMAYVISAAVMVIMAAAAVAIITVNKKEAVREHCFFFVCKKAIFFNVRKWKCVNSVIWTVFFRLLV